MSMPAGSVLQDLRGGSSADWLDLNMTKHSDTSIPRNLLALDSRGAAGAPRMDERHSVAGFDRRTARRDADWEAGRSSRSPIMKPVPITG